MIGSGTTTSSTPIISHPDISSRARLPAPPYASRSHPSSETGSASPVLRPVSRSSSYDPSSPSIAVDKDRPHRSGSTKSHSRSPWSSAIPFPVSARREDKRKRVWAVLGVMAGLGVIVFITLGRGSGWSPVGTGWGLVHDLEGLRGDGMRDLDAWAIQSDGMVKDVKVGKGTKAARPAKQNNKGKERVKGKPKVDDGLYRFNPSELVKLGGPHPITTLIKRAQMEWDAKVARQSKTLRAAVEEYRRRYNRAPPKGFEKWWAYIRQNDVPLPDEYDQISRDIHLFHPHSHSVIRQKVRETSKLSDTYTIKNTGGKITVQRNFDPAKHPGGEQRVSAQLGMFESVVEDIGDFEAVWSVHDNARIYTSWSQRRLLQESVTDGTRLEEEENEEQNGWSSLCPASTDFTSSLASAKPKTDDTSSSSKSFISSLPLSYSLCDHPELVPIHGSTAGPHRVPITKSHLPLFSYSRTSLHTDILGIPYSHLINVAPTPWEAKTDSRLLWRGGLTGSHYDPKVDWKQSQRFRAIDIAKRSGKLSFLVPTSSSETPQLVTTSYAEAAKQYLDIAATGKPIQCDKETCDLIAATYDFAPRMSHAIAGKYKYVLDIDGNAWSARFKGLLSSGTVVLKSTIMPEWWTERSQTWVHYVPLGVDYAEVMDIMAYFTGDLSGQNGHDDAARQIALAGQEWTETHWRQEDMIAYSFRLYLEWARVWGGGDVKAGYVYKEADEV